VEASVGAQRKTCVYTMWVRVSCAVTPCVCENSDGRLLAWGLC